MTTLFLSISIASFAGIFLFLFIGSLNAWICGSVDGVWKNPTDVPERSSMFFPIYDRAYRKHAAIDKKAKAKDDRKKARTQEYLRSLKEEK